MFFSCGIEFRAILASKLEGQEAQNHWKTICFWKFFVGLANLTTSSYMIDFLIDFSMRFVSQNGPQNGSQDHQTSLKNQSKTVSGLKNVIFWKIAPRLGETLFFEGPGSPKPSQNQPKMLQEPIKNPTKISIEFWMDFVVILAPFWLPQSLINDSKSDPKNVPKNRPKNHWKIMQKFNENPWPSGQNLNTVAY